MNWNYDNIVKQITKGINIEKLNLGDERELKKFRINISVIMGKLIQEPPERKGVAIQLMKVGAFKLMAQLPVITPVITAMLQVITGDDLGTKMDRMLMLQEKTISILGERLPKN